MNAIFAPPLPKLWGVCGAAERAGLLCRWNHLQGASNRPAHCEQLAAGSVSWKHFLCWMNLWTENRRTTGSDSSRKICFENTFVLLPYSTKYELYLQYICINNTEVVIMAIDYTAIGQRIKQKRVERGMTQEKLSECVGIGPSHIDRKSTRLNSSHTS